MQADSVKCEKCEEVYSATLERCPECYWQNSNIASGSRHSGSESTPAGHERPETAAGTPDPILSPGETYTKILEAIDNFRSNNAAYGIVVLIFGKPDSAKSFLVARLSDIYISHGVGQQSAEIQRTNAGMGFATEFSIHKDGMPDRRLFFVDISGESVLNKDIFFREVLTRADVFLMYIPANLLHPATWVSRHHETRSKATAFLRKHSLVTTEELESVLDQGQEAWAKIGRNFGDPENVTAWMLNRITFVRKMARWIGYQEADAVELAALSSRELLSRLTVEIQQSALLQSHERDSQIGLVRQVIDEQHKRFIAIHTGTADYRLINRESAPFAPLFDIVRTLHSRAKLASGTELTHAQTEGILEAIRLMESRGGNSYPKEVYKEAAAAIAQHAGEGKKPLFVGISKACLIHTFDPNLWAAVEAGSRNTKGAEQFMIELDPSFVEELAHKFSQVKFGFVASHVGSVSEEKNNSLPSFGVRGMVESLFEIALSERERGSAEDDKRCIIEYIGARSPARDKNAPSRLKRKIAELVSQGYAGSSRLWRLLPLLSGFGVAICFCLLAWKGASDAQSKARENLRSNISNIDVPNGFYVQPEFVWKLEDQELDTLFRLAKQAADFEGISTDSLVRAPNLEQYTVVPELGIRYEVVTPVASSANGRQVLDVYRALARCPETERECGTTALPAELTPSGPQDPTKRAFSYAQALYAYNFGLRDAAAHKNLQRLVSEFHQARVEVMGDDFPNKQERLPILATDIMLLHHELNGLKQPQTYVAMADYGRSLDRLLVSYGNNNVSLTDPTLELAGISKRVLLAHLVATAISEADDREAFKSLSLKRVGTVGAKDLTALLPRGALPALEPYPFLSCLTALFVLDGDDTALYGVCGRSLANQSKPDVKDELKLQLWERQRLTSPLTWQDMGEKSERYEIRLSDYVSAISASANAMPIESLRESEQSALKTLRSLRDPGLIEQLISWSWFFLALVALALGYVLMACARTWVRYSRALTLLRQPVYSDNPSGASRS